MSRFKWACIALAWAWTVASFTRHYDPLSVYEDPASRYQDPVKEYPDPELMYKDPFSNSYIFEMIWGYTLAAQASPTDEAVDQQADSLRPKELSTSSGRPPCR